MAETNHTEVKELKLGQTIRGLRMRKALTLEELASKTGLSVALLSQLESDVISPPVATLLKISKNLGVNIGYFFNIEETKAKWEVVRSEERKKVTRKLPHGRTPMSYSYESLAFRLPHRHMEPFLVEFDIDIEEEIIPLSHAGEEFLFLISGELEFRSENEIIILKEGDSLYFDSSLPHCFQGRGRKKPSALVVIYPEM